MHRAILGHGYLCQDKHICTRMCVPILGCRYPYWAADSCNRMGVVGCIYLYWEAASYTGMHIPILGCRFL